jgi:myo-inositol-hexaphosphate 3-phosphohydrolase
VETPGYNQRTGEVRDDWLRRLEQSTFLTIKYGLIDAEGALDRISNMERNWDSYGAEPPGGSAIRAAKEILAEFAGALILPSTIVPSAEGGVSIYFMTGHRTAYVESYNQGCQTLVMYDQNGNAEVLEIGRDIPRADVSGRVLAYLG